MSNTEDTKQPSRRQQDPEGTRRNIIEVASSEFALNGLAGARIDEIAEKTRASKRMIYYYFGDKEGLYVSALENAYRVVREGEAELDIESLPPLEGLRRLVGFTFDHHSEHEDFIRMVMIENIHSGRYMERSPALRAVNEAAIARIGSIYAKGVAEGVFRAGLDPLEIHWQISALCFFNVSNRATFSHLFGRDMSSAENQVKLRQNAIDMVFRYLAKPEYI
ncbi:MAG: TetR family transcriptional regulator [Pelagibacterium sp.]|uniref:TetR family transcriptional regulator n=1 Tax=Pelagibacterium sp. TaxID=1967288 RepID=UPI0032EE5441